jgi:ABC-2 type transport system ATP-binding protein
VAGDLVILEVSSDDQVTPAVERLRTLSGDIDVDGRHVRGRVERAGRAIPGLLRDLEAGGVSLDSIEVHRPTLDDVFLTLTGRSLRDAESEQAGDHDGDHDGDQAGDEQKEEVPA